MYRKGINRLVGCHYEELHIAIRSVLRKKSCSSCAFVVASMDAAPNGGAAAPQRGVYGRPPSKAMAPEVAL
jgi:hypothetical protein